jgi:hypothetical protein
MSAVNPLPPHSSLRKQLLALKAVAKRVQVEVLSQDNKRVIQRYRFVPPNDTQGRKTRFTAPGVDHVLENFVDSFERDNPNHKYRLVVCKDKYKLVWTPEPEPDVQKQMQEDMVTLARAAQGNSPCSFTRPIPETESNANACAGTVPVPA